MMPQANYSPATPRHVFVYGTLRAGGSNDITRWRPSAQFVGTAEIAGTLYDLGAYPGATLGGTARVRGEVHRIEPALEAQLDQLEEVLPDEQGEYFKREIAVWVGRQRIDCLVYEINPSRLSGRGVIPSGDWLRRG